MTAADVSRRHERVIEASLYSLQSRARDARDVEIDRLRTKAGELTMDNGLLDKKFERMEVGRLLVGGGRSDERRAVDFHEKDLGCLAGSAESGR